MAKKGIDHAGAFAKVMGEVFTEVFQKRPENPNTPINVTRHNYDDAVIGDDGRAKLLTLSAITYVWGAAGYSDESGGTPQSVRYDMFGKWA